MVRRSDRQNDKLDRKRKNQDIVEEVCDDEVKDIDATVTVATTNSKSGQSKKQAKKAKKVTTEKLSDVMPGTSMLPDDNNNNAGPPVRINPITGKMTFERNQISEAKSGSRVGSGSLRSQEMKQNLSIADQLEEIDREFDDVDAIDLDVHVQEDQFNSKDDALETASEHSNNESSDSDNDGEDTQSLAPTDLESNAVSATSNVIDFNFKNAKPEDFECLHNNPAFTTFIKKMVTEDNRKSVVVDKGETSARAGGARPKTTRNETPLRRGKQSKPKGKGMILKSSSDTTLYAPVLRQVLPDNNSGLLPNSPLNEVVNQGIPNPLNVDQLRNGLNMIIPSGGDSVLTDKIIDFIKGIRVETVGGGDHEHPNVGGTQYKKQQQQQECGEIREAKQKADEMVIAAEQFRRTVNAPPGMDNVVMPQPQIACQLDIDDQFFHITCHIDESIRLKIQAGQFVDLEKLLLKPKNKLNDNKLDLVYRDGHSYFVPAPLDNKINGVRKWEQAFRVYVTIYSQHNPSRSAEIWQYVHIINTAAVSYIWENVANYDYTFRQLMHQFPQHSWAKIYQQMWCMSMKDPIIRMSSGNTFHQNQNRQFNSQPSTSGANLANVQGVVGVNNTQKGPEKPNYCWAWNKGNCLRGQKCKFVNRCSYCNAGDHGLNKCAKAKENGAN